MRAISLRTRLLALIVLVLAAVLLPLGILSAMRTLEEVDELSDGRLAQAARTLEVLVGRIGVEQLRNQRARPALVPSYSNHPQELTIQGRTFESEVGFQVFDRDGSLLLATENLSGVPRTHAPDGRFEDVSSGRYQWRIFTLIMENKGITIRAGERYDSRHEITHALWIEHGLPTLLGLPLLAVLVGWAIHRGLRPLGALAEALARREPGSREPIHLPNAPTELKPVLVALNDQIGRLESALERERRFSADVAHELRTPLASTMINLESAMVSARPDEAQLALEAARECLVSLARRTEQLLALARLEVGAASGPRGRVDLVELALDVIEELATVIGAGGVELELVELPEHVWLEGYAVALAALLRNLLENAFRHVPRGGHVGLSIRGDDAGFAVIEVVDDGPGIPAERRAGMFTRFQRGLDTQGEGYGLGLSIVQRAAELHGATIELLDRDEGTGLRVVVRIPRASVA